MSFKKWNHHCYFHYHFVFKKVNMEKEIFFHVAWQFFKETKYHCLRSLVFAPQFFTVAALNEKTRSSSQMNFSWLLFGHSLLVIVDLGLLNPCKINPSWSPSSSWRILVLVLTDTSTHTFPHLSHIKTFQKLFLNHFPRTLKANNIRNSSNYIF